MSTISYLVLTALVSLGSTHIYAQQSNDKMPSASMMTEPTKEQRAKMADMHAQAAECLKSGKPFNECHKQMMDNCPMAQDGSCTMMGMRKMQHRGMKSGNPN